VKGGVSRRDLFAFWRKPAAPGPEPDPLRPPGAIADELLVGTCRRSGHCVDACPRQAIFPLDDGFGRARGTPALRARSAPCVVCAELACTQACPSGALERVAVSEVRMGTACVDAASCVAWRGEPCVSCVTSCPVPGAIRRSAEGHPVVDDAHCIGCGVCEHVCPTPRASIAVVPARRLAR
jgi:MauM/NapG family ferredoxin protein